VKAGCRGIPRGDDTGAPGHTTVQPPAVATGRVRCTSTLRRNRDFTKLWIGEAVSTLGSRNSYVAYPLLVLAVTGSPAQAGLVGFARQLPLFLFQLPAGALADRWNRRLLMIACDAGRAAAMASLAAALLLGTPSLALIFVVAFVEGTLNVAFRPAEVGALKQIVPAADLTNAIAANEARDNAAFLAGPSLGGFLFAVARAAPFLADAISYVVSLGCVVLIRRRFEEERAVAERRSLRRDVAEGLVWLWRRPFLRASLLLAGATNLVSNGLALLVILVARERGASSSAIGLMLTLVAAGGLAGAVATPVIRRRASARRIVLGLPWLYALLIPTFAFVPGTLALGGVFGVMLFLGPAWNATVVGYGIAVTPDGLQGRRASMDWLLSGSGVAAAPLLAGLLFGAAGATAAIAAFAALEVAIAVAATVSPALRVFPSVAPTAAPGETRP
jgi:MFS family permease